MSSVLRPAALASVLLLHAGCAGETDREDLAQPSAADLTNDAGASSCDLPALDGAATTSLHTPNSRSSSSTTGRSDSHTRSSPVTPASAAPSATNSGMSCARTKIASNSPPSDATSARSPSARTSSPASAKSSRASSANRPLLGSAILSMDPRLFFEGDYEEASGHRAAEAFLPHLQAGDAVFFANDQMAIGAIEAWRGRGIRVPEDVRVAAYDNHPMSRHANPPLTTVGADMVGVGAEALRQLHRVIHGQRGLAPIEFPTGLIVRQSCGCAESRPPDSPPPPQR